MTYFEIKDASGEIISKRKSIQFARSDASKVFGATIRECVEVGYDNNRKYTLKFAAE